MDEDVQALVRMWATTQSLDDGVRAARARLRAGLLTEDDARLAATLGDPIALALGFAPYEVEWPGWPHEYVVPALAREHGDLVRGVLATFEARSLGAASPSLREATTGVQLARELERITLARDRRVVDGWIGDEPALRRALGAVTRDDARWLERRLAMTLLFGPDLLPPVEPWTPPAPPRPPRPRPLLGP